MLAVAHIWIGAFLAAGNGNGAWAASLLDRSLDLRAAAVSPVSSATSPPPPTTSTTAVDVSRFPMNICGRPAPFPTDRIVGGQLAQPYQVPWQAQLLTQVSDGSFAFICGGTLVTENLVISAAHCFEMSSSPSDYLVNLGKQLVDQTTVECNAQQYSVRNLTIHPGYSSTALNNDIALIFLVSKYEQSARFTDYAVPACLPLPGTQYSATSLYAVGTSGKISGWGKLSENSSSASSTLQSANVPISDPVQCNSVYSKLGVKVDPSSQFCAGLSSGGVDACAGDSGGPFMVQANGVYILAGVVSYGKGCAEAGFPGVYTNVQFFLSWILDRMSEQPTANAAGSSSSGAVVQTTASQTTTKSTTTTATTTTTRSTTTTTTTTTRTTTRPITTTTTAKVTSTTTMSTTTTPSPTLAPTSLPAPADGLNIRSPSGSAPMTLGPICGDFFRFISCSGNQVLTIDSAFNGKDSSVACPTAASAAYRCSTAGAVTIVRTSCQGSSGCWIFPDMFGAICRKADSFTSVSYRCINSMVATINM